MPSRTGNHSGKPEAALTLRTTDRCSRSPGTSARCRAAVAAPAFSIAHARALEVDALPAGGGLRDSSPGTLRALCVTLDVPFARLFDPPRPRTRVVRADEGLTAAAAEADDRATLPAAGPPGVRRDLYRIDGRTGHRAGLRAAHAGGRRARAADLGARPRRPHLRARRTPVRDYVAYPGDLPHLRGAGAARPGRAGDRAQLSEAPTAVEGNGAAAFGGKRRHSCRRIRAGRSAVGPRERPGAVTGCGARGPVLPRRGPRPLLWCASC